MYLSSKNKQKKMLREQEIINSCTGGIGGDTRQQRNSTGTVGYSSPWFIWQYQISLGRALAAGGDRASAAYCSHNQGGSTVQYVYMVGKKHVALKKGTLPSWKI